MSSKETTITQEESQKDLTKKSNAGVAVVPMRTVRRRNSLRPTRSILKVRSLRPTKAVMGKAKEE